MRLKITEEALVPLVGSYLPRLTAAFHEMWLKESWHRFPLTRTLLTTAFSLESTDEKCVLMCHHSWNLLLMHPQADAERLHGRCALGVDQVASLCARPFSSRNGIERRMRSLPKLVVNLLAD